MNRFIKITIAGLLSACTSMEAHDAKPYATSFEVQENYQAVFARTLKTMRGCTNPGQGYLFSPVTEQMDAQLYPDLGYGEITRYQANLSAIPWSTTRIAKKGSATLVSIRAAGWVAEFETVNRRKIRDFFAKTSAAPSDSARKALPLTRPK